MYVSFASTLGIRFLSLIQRSVLSEGRALDRSVGYSHCVRASTWNIDRVLYRAEVTDAWNELAAVIFIMIHSGVFVSRLALISSCPI